MRVLFFVGVPLRYALHAMRRSSKQKRTHENRIRIHTHTQASSHNTENLQFERPKAD